MKQTDPQFKIRLTPELKEQLESAAGDTRTISAEIVDRLQKSFEPHPAEQRVIDLRNAILAQGALIALQAGFISIFSKNSPPDSPEAKFADLVATHFGASLAEKSAVGLPHKDEREQAEVMRKLAGFGAELRSTDLEGDAVHSALSKFASGNPDLIPSKSKMAAKKAGTKTRPAKPKT